MQALLELGGVDMPQRGDIREGVILQVNQQEIIIDLGLKREGIVPANDLTRLDKDTLAAIQPGSTWPVYILQPSDREGNTIMSLSCPTGERLAGCPEEDGSRRDFRGQGEWSQRRRTRSARLASFEVLFLRRIFLPCRAMLRPKSVRNGWLHT